MINKAQLAALAPSAQSVTLDTYVDAINKTFDKFQIVTKARQAMFLANILHETGELKSFSENLNYSSTALVSVWPSHFDVSTAIKYQRNPQAIANRAYANRMGNGNEASGDGWKFRGRGCIQITGRSNYTALAHDMGMTLDDCVNWCATPLGAVESAGWFWNRGRCNSYADRGDVAGCRKVVNGGTIGLDDVQARYTKALHTL